MRLPAALLAMLLLAGCTTPDAPADELDAAAPAPRSDATPTAALDAPFADAPAEAGAAPTWRVGDAWEVTFLGGESAAAVFVVTEASGASYTLATTSAATASYDAMFDVSYLGRIRASDLAGEQGGAPVQYFSFPLEDGKTWTATWDGREVALQATRTATGFDIVGTVDGAPYVAYDYAPALKWWSGIEFAEGYGFKVARATSGWSGEIARATAEVVFEGAPAAPVASPGTGAFTIDEGQTMAMVTVHGGGSAWARAFEVIQPDGTPYMETQIDEVEVGDAGGGGPHVFTYQGEIPPTPGEWRIVAPMVHDPAGWGIVTVHQVRVETVAFAA